MYITCGTCSMLNPNMKKYFACTHILLNVLEPAAERGTDDSDKPRVLPDGHIVGDKSQLQLSKALKDMLDSMKHKPRKLYVTS